MKFYLFHINNFLFGLKNMSLCCELKYGFCCHIRTTVNVGLVHFFIYGLFAVCFVYSNSCYPELYYADHLFGGSGASLMCLTILGSILAHSNFYQPIRFILGMLLALNALLIIAGTYYYTFERWYDVEVTAIVAAIRPPAHRDFVDYFWHTLAVICCINCVIFVIYVPYILSFFGHKWKAYLFTTNRRESEYTIFTHFSIPSVPSYNASSANNTK